MGPARPNALEIDLSVVYHAMLHRLSTFYIPRDIKVVSLVQKSRPFCQAFGFYLLVELHLVKGVHLQPNNNVCRAAHGFARV